VLNIGSEKNFAAASLKLAIIVGTDNSNGDQSLSTLNLYGGNLGNLSVNTKNTVALKTLEISTITRNANFEKDAIFSVKIGFDKDANQYQASALNLTDKGNFGIATFKTNLTLQIDVEKKPNTSQEFAILTAKK
jgi:hypothetical protein